MISWLVWFHISYFHHHIKNDDENGDDKHTFLKLEKEEQRKK